MRLSAPATPALLLTLAALAIGYAMHTPEPRPASAPPADFSAERAMAHVREIARLPHPSGSEAHAAVRRYLALRISGLGLEPEVQNVTGVGTRYASAGQVYNVLARIPGLLPARERGAVLLVAHYDGVAAGPAASDDGAGVGALLETMRALREGPLPANDVIVLFSDAEEPGLLGAAAFVREHPWARDVGVILNFETRGVHGPSLMFETGRGNADVIRFLRSVPGARATSLSTAVYRALPNDTDLSEFALLDRPAMNFAFIGGVERYHTTEDDTTHLSRGSLQHHGDQALALARAFAGAKLPRPETRDAVFFDLPFVGIVAYPEWLGILLAVAGLAVVVALVVVLRRGDAGAIRGLAAGAAGLLLSLLLAGVLASGAAALFATLHAALPGGGAPQWRGVYASALTMLAVALVAAAFAVLRRVADARTLHAGALLLLALVAAYVSSAMPGAGWLFAWPTLLAGLAALVAALARGRFTAIAVRWVATVIIVFLLVPMLYLMVCVALGVAGLGAALLGAFTAITVWLLLPHLQDVAGERPWRIAAAALVVATGLSVLGAATVRTDARTPAGLSFVYAVDADSGSAWVAGWGTTRGGRAWLERSLAATRGGTGEAPRWLLRSFPPARVAPAQPVAVAAPSATIVSDSTTADARLVTVLVRPAGEMAAIDVVAETGTVLEAWVDGRPVNRSRYRRLDPRWSLEYVAPRAEGFTLRLALRPGEPHALSLMGRTSGLPPGVPVPQRPPGLLPIQTGDATHVYHRVPL